MDVLNKFTSNYTISYGITNYDACLNVHIKRLFIILNNQNILVEFHKN